ncbi:ABC-type transport auxiliary lipoprotein family protein [Marinobacter lipolyticus]|uniref:ABC-type transport auxiliary lipoprotein family protein n=1 Tax=Marinobacter lipolyticus TaxID=209639 RepID=UPI003A8E3D76
MTTRLAVALATIAMMGVAPGCTVFPDHEPPRVMDIPTPGLSAQDGASTLDKTVRIDTPQATEPFDSSRILTKPAPHEYQIYGDVRWRDTAPVLVREILIGALRQDGRFQGVVNETSPTGSDVTLISDLYGFHSQPGDSGIQVIVSLYAQLMDNRSRTTVCTKNFRVTTDAEGTDIDQVVKAFGHGSEELSQQMLGWLSECLDP